MQNLGKINWNLGIYQILWMGGWSGWIFQPFCYDVCMFLYLWEYESCSLHFHLVSWLIVAFLQHIVIFPRGLCCSVVKVCMPSDMGTYSTYSLSVRGLFVFEWIFNLKTLTHSRLSIVRCHCCCTVKLCLLWRLGRMSIFQELILFCVCTCSMFMSVHHPVLV